MFHFQSLDMPLCFVDSLELTASS